MYDNYNYFGILLAIVIILFGIIVKPLVGIIDFTARMLETTSLTINDVLSNRVQRFARYRRFINNNHLTVYNSSEALSYIIYSFIYKKVPKDDKFLVVPCYITGVKKLVLFTLDTLVIVDYINRRFKSSFQIHFSECKLFRSKGYIQEVNLLLTHSGKKIIFWSTSNNENFIFISFESKINKCFSNQNINLKIKLESVDNIILKEMDYLIEMIFEKKICYN